MDLQARKPIFIFLTALLLMAMASACTTRSISGSQTSFPGAQLSIPEPTSIQLSTVELGTVTQYLSPELWGLLYQQVTEETVPERVSVMIYENKVDTTPGLSDYITAAGGTSSGDMLWEVPSSLLQSLVLRPDVAKMWLQTDRTTRHVSTDPYPTLGLNDALDDVVEAHAAGVPAGQAALYSFFMKDGQILVSVTAPDVATETAIRTWLTTRNIFLHSQTQSGARDTLYIMVVLPVEQILPLAQAYPSATLEGEDLISPGITLSRAHWDAEILEASTTPVDWWTTPLASDGTSGGSTIPQLW